MMKTTEGTQLAFKLNPTNQEVMAAIKQLQVKPVANLTRALPLLACYEFSANVINVVDNVEDARIPDTIRPILQELYTACDDIAVHRNEQIIQKKCQKAIEACGQGWNYLCYWKSREQSLCYGMFWGLKLALNKHQSVMAQFTTAKNDGAQMFDSTLPKSPRDPKLADFPVQQQPCNLFPVPFFSIGQSNAVLKTLTSKANEVCTSVMKCHSNGFEALVHALDFRARIPIEQKRK